MSDDVGPRNELEKSLLAAQKEEISSDGLLYILMNSQVFMPVLIIQRSAHAQPLTLNAGECINGYPGLDAGFDMEPDSVNELLRGWGSRHGIDCGRVG